jgi:outer membrane cobalamin receptor
VRPGELDIAEKFRNSGVYTQADVKLPYLNIVPALRLDYHTEFGWMFSPKIGVSSRVLDNLTLRASFGDAFRAPSTVELYGDMVVGTYKIRGNSNLLAEKVRALDCGFEADLFSGITIQSNLFYNSMKNLITIAFDGQLLNGIVTNGNLDNAYSCGVENEITWRPYKPLTISVNYTFTESENLRYKEALDYIPRNKFNAMIMFGDTLGPGVLQVSVYEGFVGKRHYADWKSIPTIRSRRVNDKSIVTFTPKFVALDPYFRTDLSCSYTFKNKHEIVFDAQNLFDAYIEESGGTLSPARFAVLKYSVPFNF